MSGLSRTGAHPRRRLTAALWAASVLSAILIPITAVPAAGCAVESNVPGQVFLEGFTRGAINATPSDFYMVGEDSGPADVTIAVYPAACVDGGARARATYTTRDLVATAPADYTSRSGQTDPMCDDHHHAQYCGENAPPPSRNVAVPIADDALGTEAAVRPFLFDLTGGTNGGVGDPGEAPVYIVDDDGSLRFSLEPNRAGTDAVSYSRPEGYFIEIPVFRAGPDGAATSVPYDITSTGANPAVAGTDYIVPASQEVSFEAGQRFSFIRMEVPQDYTADGDKTIQITLEGNVVSPSPGDTTVALPDSRIVVRDTTPPVTKFHHPKQGLVYKKGDYRLRSMHVYDQGGSDAKRVQMALRKRTEDNQCSWFKQGAWRPGACDAPLWLDMKKFKYQFKGKDLYHRSFSALKPSEGSWVKDYQAWSRGWDQAGNVEDTFTKGRNFNTFFVSKSAG